MCVVHILGTQLKRPPWPQQHLSHLFFPENQQALIRLTEEHLENACFEELCFAAISVPRVPQETMLEQWPFPVALQGLHRKQGKISLHQCRSKHGNRQSPCNNICLSHVNLAIRFSFLVLAPQKRIPAIHGSKAHTEISFFATHNTRWANQKQHIQIPFPAMHMFAFLLNLPVLMACN